MNISISIKARKSFIITVQITAGVAIAIATVFINQMNDCVSDLNE